MICPLHPLSNPLVVSRLRPFCRLADRPLGIRQHSLRIVTHIPLHSSTSRFHLLVDPMLEGLRKNQMKPITKPHVNRTALRSRTPSGALWSVAAMQLRLGLS